MGQRAAEGHWQVLSGLWDHLSPRKKKALDSSDIYNGFCPPKLSNYLYILTFRKNCVPLTSPFTAEAAVTLPSAVLISPQPYSCWCFWGKAFPRTLHIVKLTKPYYVSEKSNHSRHHRFIRTSRDSACSFLNEVIPTRFHKGVDLNNTFFL